ncbi:MAG: hypothetical protein AAFX87_16165 [Bacteroidota bacterium]
MNWQVILDDWPLKDGSNFKRQDIESFSSMEEWEVDYLESKINELYHDISARLIRSAIYQCCDEIAPPRPKKQFVTSVLKKLNRS